MRLISVSWYARRYNWTRTSLKTCLHIRAANGSFEIAPVISLKIAGAIFLKYCQGLAKRFNEMSNYLFLFNQMFSSWLHFSTAISSSTVICCIPISAIASRTRFFRASACWYCILGVITACNVSTLLVPFKLSERESVRSWRVSEIMATLLIQGPPRYPVW